VGDHVPQLGVDTLFHLFVFDAGDFHTIVAIDAKGAGVDFFTLLELNICAVARKVGIPGIPVFVSGSE
jgi:hypothetical protein